MKITLTIIFLGLITSLGAQSYIRVSNNPGAIADYTNLQTAIDNAPVGSTIFVEPSATSYGNVVVSKRLILLGGGYDATKHNNKKAQIGSITFNKQIENPDGTIISGFYLSSTFGNGSNAYNLGVDNITVQRCQLESAASVQIKGSSSDSVTGWKIINCKLNQISASYAKNILISNNLLNHQISGFDQNSVFFTNNILTSTLIYLISNANYSNNVFNLNIPTACSNCTFSNNLTKEGSSSLNYGDNICTNNIEGVPSTNIFVSAGSDYHLKSTCPGVLAGSDGKDIGIYGGLFPFPDEDYGITGYPEIMSLSITNPVVEPNGTLKVNVKSKIIH